MITIHKNVAIIFQIKLKINQFESIFVIVQPLPLLVERRCLPPFRRFGSDRPNAHVPGSGAINHPGFTFELIRSAGERGEFRRIQHFRIRLCNTHSLRIGSAARLGENRQCHFIIPFQRIGGGSLLPIGGGTIAKIPLGDKAARRRIGKVHNVWIIRVVFKGKSYLIGGGWRTEIGLRIFLRFAGWQQRHSGNGQQHEIKFII